VPIDADAHMTPGHRQQRLGLVARHPSVLIPGYGVHGLARPQRQHLVHLQRAEQLRDGRQDRHQTGAVKPFKVNAANGLGGAHGLTRDPNGILWFNVNPGKGGLGRLDPKTGRSRCSSRRRNVADRRRQPVDFDGKGFIWSSSPAGALRFDRRRRNCRVQVGDLQDSERHRRDLRLAADKEAAALLGRDDPRHHRPRSDTGREADQAAADQGGLDRERPTRRSTPNTRRPTSTRRSRGTRARAAWASTRTATCCGSAPRGAARSRASTPTRRS
jgi:hypothetical protein